MAPDAPPPRLQRLRRLVTGVPFLVTVGVLAVLALAYILAGFFLVPRLVRRYVPRYVQEQLKRRAEIGEVRVNPFLFKVEIKQFRLMEADGRPLLGFDRLFVDFELSSLFRRAWTFAEIQLDAPRLDAVLARDGRLNIADLLDSLPRSEPPPQPAPPRRMILTHAVVRRGALSFTDLTGRRPQRATVEPIDVELHDITTLPERRGPYAISATLNGGGVVSWGGEVSLVPLASTGRVELRGFPLSTPWRFLQEEVALAQPAGALDAAVRYQVGYRDGAASVKVEGLDVTVAGLALTPRGDSVPLLALEKIHLAGGRGDLIARELTVDELSLSRGRLAATMARDGTLDWQRLMTSPPGPVAAGAGGVSPVRPGAGAPTVRRVPPDAGGAAVPAGPGSATARAASPARPAAPPGAAAAGRAPAAAAAPGAGATGGASPAPAAARPAAPSGARPWRVAVNRIGVEELALALTDRSRARPIEITAGELTVGLAAKLETGSAGLSGVVEDLGVKLARVAMREAGAAKTPLVSLDQIAVEGGHVDLGKRQVAVSRVTVKGGGTAIVRAADGSLPLLTMLGPADHGQPPRPSGGPPPTPPSSAAGRRPGPADGAAATRPWTVALARLELTDHHLAITDQGVSPPIQLDVTKITVKASDLRTDGQKPFPFEASFGVASGGRVTARGRAAPDGASAEATLTVTQLAMTPAQPYVARTAAVTLRSGAVSTAGRLTYRRGRDRATLTYTGALDVDGVNVVEAASGDPVVGWRSLHADTVRLGLAPDRLHIDEVRLTGLDGKLEILKDRSLSLSRLMKPATTSGGSPPPGAAPATGGRAGATPASPPPPAAEAPAAPPFPWAIERVRVDRGSAHFADLSLVLPFATRVHFLNGTIVGLASDPASRATVKLDGRVDEFGLVKVDGALSAFRPKEFTDITVIFRNVPMSNLSPYSATFAGRRIRAGTLDLDLEYKIEHSVLEGQNKVFLRQLQLGERVESPGAMRLPLDLAIAILSDSQGRINLELPVKGNVDRPEFSYGHLIWQALVTVITKVVTSPFRALAGLVGGSAEHLQTIDFEPGSDRVLPPEREKLQKVAEILGKRDKLKLTVHGGYEAKLDGEALRSLHVREDLAQRLGVKLRAGEDPGPVAFDQPKTQRALEALLTQRAGDKALDELVKGYGQRTGKKVDRVNPVLALVGKGGGDRSFYEALFRRLVEIAPLPEAEITALGQRRGEATARVLRQRAGEAASRVEVGPPEAAGRAERNEIPTRLELGAVGS